MKFISFHFICQKDKKINIRLKAFWENENWFYNLSPIYDDDDDDELFLWNGWLTKGVKHYFQLTPLSDSHHHKSPTYHRIWDCAEPQFRLCWRKLCSSDNHFTRVPQQCIFTIYCSIQHYFAALQINIPLLVTMNRKIKKLPVKLNFWQSQ